MSLETILEEELSPENVEKIEEDRKELEEEILYQGEST